MNLKKNYERYFGKIEESTKPNKEVVLNEGQMQRFSNLSSALGRKYPNAPLTIKNGYVYVGFKKLEEATKFLYRTSLNIQETVRSIANSGKKGLL